jgi:hypothetical protein
MPAIYYQQVQDVYLQQYMLACKGCCQFKAWW